MLGIVPMMNEQTFAVKTPNDFMPVIMAILSLTENDTDSATLITLIGDLGAGKTTFTQRLAAHLGIIDPVTSPTFGIIKSYELTDNRQFDQLVHIDAYRIEAISEVGPLRMQEYFEAPRTLICLEWPEKIVGMLPKERIEVSILIGENEERIVNLKPNV